MTISLWRYLVDTTNEYARSRIGRMPPQRRSLFRWWRDVTVEEMKAFVGVIINMGMLKLTDIKEYWSTHTTTNLPFFRRVFSRDRFLQIYWMLHVGDLSSTTKRAKVQPFVDKVIPLFQQYLIPSRELSIDEAMIAFRGKVAFRVYIRGKPHPWGIKAYVLSESRSGYLHNIIIYYGKETKIVHIPGLNHTTNVVLTLMAPLANTASLSSLLIISVDMTASHIFFSFSVSALVLIRAALRFFIFWKDIKIIHYINAININYIV